MMIKTVKMYFYYYEQMKFINKYLIIEIIYQGQRYLKKKREFERSL